MLSLSSLPVAIVVTDTSEKPYKPHRIICDNANNDENPTQIRPGDNADNDDNDENPKT